MSPITTCAPLKTPQITRAISPFEDPRPPPCTPRATERLWDEYEKRAVENARRREAPHFTCPPNQKVLDVFKSMESHGQPRRQNLPPSLATRPQLACGQYLRPAPSTSVVTCKLCQQPILSVSGICERCKKTIILPSLAGETTPALSPAARNFASTNLPQLQKASSLGTNTAIRSSPKRKGQRRPSAQLMNPPIRLSSLRPPPPTQDAVCKSSLPQASDQQPANRLLIARKPIAHHPPSPSSHSPPAPLPPPYNTSTSTTTAHPSSLANVTTTPTTTRTSVTAPASSSSSSRHTSATPSDLSTLYPHTTSTSTSPSLSTSTTATATATPSVCRTSYQLQNTTSAWDEWESDEDGEQKVGLVGYWKARKWRGSRGSRGSIERGESNDAVGSGKGEQRRRRGFARVFSCGCGGK